MHASDLEASAALEGLVKRPVHTRLKTSGNNRRWNPVKLSSKIMYTSVDWNLPVLKSDFWIASIHYLTIKAKKLRALKPTFPFSAVKPFGTPLLYHTPAYQSHLLHWEIKSILFPSATIQISMWQATLESLSIKLWAFPPAVTFISHVLYLQASSKPHPWKKKKSTYANKGLGKMLLDQVSQHDFKHQSPSASLLILECC